MSGDGAAHRELARYLTGSEAKQLADRLAAGGTMTQALTVVAAARRTRVQALMREAGLGVTNRDPSVAVLRAIEGAHDHQTSVTPVWTAPANLVQSGGLTASIEHFVLAARESVVCSTFNFQRSSVLWKSLATVAARTEVSVRIYVDTEAADAQPRAWSPTTEQIAAELPGAVVLRTGEYDGRAVRNHAKFIAVDHQYLIVTSANFSKSAEQYNVELGLQINDPLLTQAVERQMRALEDLTYRTCVSSPARDRKA